MAGRRTVSTLEVRLAGDIQDALQGMEQVGTRAQKLGRDMRRTGFQLTERFSLPLAAVGGISLKVAADFEKAMNRVRGLTGATGDEFEALEQQAQDLGRTTAFSASEAGDAMGFLAMAGFETQEILATLPDVLNLAAAAQMDLGEAADITSNILTGYGMTVEELGHANDVLTRTFSSANVDLRHLGEGFKTVGPIASELGLEFEEVAATLGVMGKAGVQGQEAGTALRVGLGRLLNPVGNVREALNSLGLTVQDVDPQMHSLTEIVGALEGAGADAGDILKIFGQRGAAIAPLIGQGADAIRELEGQVRDSGGAAEKMAQEQLKGLPGAFKQLQSSAEAVAIAFSESGVGGAVTTLAKGFAALLRAISKVNPVVFQMAAAAGAVLAAAGPLMTATGALVSTFGLLLTPTGAVVAGLAALAAGAVYVANNWDELRIVATKIWMGIQDVVFTAVSGILDRLEALAGWVPGLGEKIRELRRDFDAFADEALANSLESLNEQERALRENADAASEQAEQAKKAAREARAQGDAASDAASDTRDYGRALGDAAGKAGQLADRVSTLSTRQRRVFEDIGRRTQGRQMLPSEEFGRLSDDIAEGRTRLRELGEEGEQAGVRAGRGLGDAFESGVSRAVRNFEDLHQVASDILSSLKSQLIDTLVSGLFASGGPLGGLFGGLFGGIFGGGRQHGGPVQPGRAFLVGEVGPELFVPPSAGRIVPDVERAAARGAAGRRPVVNVRVPPPDVSKLPPPMTPREAARDREWIKLMRATEREMELVRSEP